MRKMLIYCIFLAAFLWALPSEAQTATAAGQGGCCFAIASDVVVDDSDKTLTVPVAREWTLRWIRVELTTTATVGNRQLTLEIRDDTDDILYNVDLGATIPASQTGVIRHVSIDGAGSENTLVPAFRLKAGWDIHILDSAAIDATADDLVIHAMYDELAQ